MGIEISCKATTLKKNDKIWKIKAMHGHLHDPALTFQLQAGV